jgi:AGZA family xanthine/uracil permease-like MFS transporter
MMGGASLMGSSHQSAGMSKPRWWTAGDLDGFLGLGLDNLIQILLIVALCRGVLAYPDSLIFGAILPATGISLVVGNLTYARQAFQLEQREGRDDRTALHYGINTVSLFAYVFLVKLTAISQGLDPASAVTLS